MHKIRRLFLSLLLFPLALLSCGNSRIYGHYAFQMGSDKGSHFGIFTDLTKDDYYVEDEETHEKTLMGKTFKFGANLSEDMVPEWPEREDYPDDPAGFIEQLFLWTMVELLNVEQNPDAGVTGYYNIGDKVVEGKGRKLDMVIVLAEFLPVDSDFLQKFLISYLDGKNMKIILPVSVQDFRYQLCWYGTFVKFDITEGAEDPLVIEDLPGTLPGPQGEDRIGSHPTEKEIQDMNEQYADFFAKYDPNFEFRDFNTLTVELLKA